MSSLVASCANAGAMNAGDSMTSASALDFQAQRSTRPAKSVPKPRTRPGNR
jgi:hypothetical protein